jgi:hypothetical protein
LGGTYVTLARVEEATVGGGGHLGKEGKAHRNSDRELHLDDWVLDVEGRWRKECDTGEGFREA